MRVSRRLLTLAAALALAFAVPFAVTLLLTGSAGRESGHVEASLYAWSFYEDPDDEY